MKLKVDIRELKGKVKKGTHIYVKAEKKGSKPSYYKWDGKTPIDAYIQYHASKYDKRIKKISLAKLKKAFITKEGEKQSKILKRYSKKLEKKGLKINDNLRKGKSKTQEYDALKTTNNKIRELNRQLLRPLVLDKGIIELLLKNTHKMKHRYQHEIELIGEQGQRIGWTRKTGMTIEKTIKMLKEDFKKDEFIDSPTIGKKQGKWKFECNGILKRVNIITTFMRGK